MNPESRYANARLQFMCDSLDIELDILAVVVHQLTKNPVHPAVLSNARDRFSQLNQRLQWSLRALEPSTARRTATPPPMAPIFNQALYDDVFEEEIAAADEEPLAEAREQCPETLRADGLLTGEYGFWQFIRHDPKDRRRWHVRCRICQDSYSRFAAAIRNGGSRCCQRCFNRYGGQVDILLDTLKPGRKPKTPKALLDAKTGDFGFWTFLSVSDKTDNKWNVRCNICKKEYVRTAYSLRRGDSSSCRDCAKRYGSQTKQILATRPKKPERSVVPKPPAVPKVPLGDFAFWRILGNATKGKPGQYLTVLCLLCNQRYDRLAGAIRYGGTRCCKHCARKYGSPAIAGRLKEAKQEHAKTP